MGVGDAEDQQVVKENKPKWDANQEKKKEQKTNTETTNVKSTTTNPTNTEQTECKITYTYKKHDKYTTRIHNNHEEQCKVE